MTPTTAAPAAPAMDRYAPAPPAHLLDIDAVTGVHAAATRNIPGTLPFFATHFPRQPILPGVMLLGTAEEVAALACPPSVGGWRLRSAVRARWKHPVLPGDQVRVRAEVTGADDDAVQFKVAITVKDQLVADVRKLILVPRAPSTAAVHPEEDR
ncbi:3-hydroxyacyl-ACP dehydratase FabZ family protein [Streptomyces sp. NPDC059037]|uniref:3-hydroxyacyl-ACP dehydratase FabZ family protein n=1 Tax=Streptomyces sp. NPDC059037 TaxID=3346710 RepID=UPI00367CEE1A